MFEETFWKVARKYSIDEWYMVADSDLMDEVFEEIARMSGIYFNSDDDLLELLCDNVKGFEEWYNEMVEDL